MSPQNQSPLIWSLSAWQTIWETKKKWRRLFILCINWREKYTCSSRCVERRDCIWTVFKYCGVQSYFVRLVACKTQQNVAFNKQITRKCHRWIIVVVIVVRCNLCDQEHFSVGFQIGFTYPGSWHQCLPRNNLPLLVMTCGLSMFQCLSSNRNCLLRICLKTSQQTQQNETQKKNPFLSDTNVMYTSSRKFSLNVRARF